MRAANLTDALLAAGHRVVLWSSDFYHQDSRHLTGRDSHITVHDDLEVRLIHSRGYSRNVGPGRLVDHAQLALRLRRLLKEVRLPDVAFVGYPPIEPAAVMTRWLRERGVPTLLDVKDQWPDVLLRAVPAQTQAAGRLALGGYSYLGRRAMRDATAMSSISEPFLEWALDFAGRARQTTDIVAPLTVRPLNMDETNERASADWWDALGVAGDSRPRVAFVGTLGTSFDMRPVARAARDNPAIQFVLCGTGSRESDVRKLLADYPNVVLPGWVNHHQSATLYARSMAVLAPYVETHDFSLSIPNKVFDALQYGLPVVTSLQGTAKSEVLDRGAGFRYCPTDDSLSAGLRRLSSDAEWRQRMSNAALWLHDTQYSYDIVYGGLVRHLEGLAATRLTNPQHV